MNKGFMLHSLKIFVLEVIVILLLVIPIIIIRLIATFLWNKKAAKDREKYIAIKEQLDREYFAYLE